jgi:hypothetical protein
MSVAFESGGFSELERFVAYDHPNAAPVATGGRVADADQIAKVRETVVGAVSGWRERGSVSRLEIAAFDLTIGSALHDALQIIPGDAAHDEVWNFLTLVVLPDVAVLRFPDMHPDRMFGTNRNALRRAWLRRDVLGDLTDRYRRPLGEDEMVGLFERSAMARNRPLIRALGSAVMEYEGPARSEWARELYKRVRYSTGPRALDGFTQDELAALVRGKERE